MADDLDPILSVDATEMEEAYEAVTTAINTVHAAVAVMPEGQEKVDLQAFEAFIDSWHLKVESKLANHERSRADRNLLIESLEGALAALGAAERGTKATLRAGIVATSAALSNVRDEVWRSTRRI